ncbi:MAG: LptF/LptG family permease [Treponema sp.]|nr:LptF/LptG family permease [Treponema sp.]
MNRIMILDRYLLRQFFPIFFIAISMFGFVLIIIDLFANLVNFMQNDVSVSIILQITMYFIPKSLTYALPISLLFAAAYVIGDLYAKNELTSIFSAGIPFWRFSIPFVVVGFLASVFSFYFDDSIVIPATKIKNDMTRRALGRQVTERNSNIVIKTNDGRLVYFIEFFEYDGLIINNVTIVETDEKGKFISQIRAPSAEWKETHWEFRNALIYQYEEGILRVSPLGINTSYNEHPDVFKISGVIFKELPAKEVKQLVSDLRRSGYPYYEAQTDYYHRYSFSATPLIVMMLSVSMGGRFKKNILLMSLFTSLVAAVVYYVTEMLSTTMAGYTYIHPAVGAWFPVCLFIAIGISLIRSTKT